MSVQRTTQFYRVEIPGSSTSSHPSEKDQAASNIRVVAFSADENVADKIMKLL